MFIRRFCVRFLFLFFIFPSSIIIHIQYLFPRFSCVRVIVCACAQVNLRSVGRKRFAHLSESQDEIHVDANIPWGEDTLFTLEFRADEGGRYALHTCNNR